MVSGCAWNRWMKTTTNMTPDTLQTRCQTAGAQNTPLHVMRHLQAGKRCSDECKSNYMRLIWVIWLLGWRSDIRSKDWDLLYAWSGTSNESNGKINVENVHPVIPNSSWPPCVLECITCLGFGSVVYSVCHVLVCQISLPDLWGARGCNGKRINRVWGLSDLMVQC